MYVNIWDNKMFHFFCFVLLYDYIRTSHLCNCGQGFAGAASRYLGFRSMMTLLGPMYLFF
jgi:hypothetical protein